MKYKGQLHVPAALPPGKDTGADWTEGLMGSRPGLNGFGEDKIFCLYQD